MSSTSNVQNLLSNVFRPTFVYNTLSNYYQTKLELINIDTISANTITAFAANISDSRSNAYIGSGTGNPNSALDSSSNVNNTFVGTNAGASSQNVSNGVLVGYLAASAGGGVGSISLGANTINGGNSNIYIGYGTGISAGNNNIFIGPGITSSGTLPSNTSNTLIIGNGGTPTIIGDLVGHRVGINMSNLPVTIPLLTLDVNGFARIGGVVPNGGLGINRAPGDFTLDVNGNMRVSDGYGLLRFSNDASGVSRTSISGIVGAGSGGGAPAAVGIATLQVADGFFSASGTTDTMSNGELSNIGVWKKGIVAVSVQDVATSDNYVGQMSMVRLIGSTYTVVDISSNVSNATITATDSNIVLTNNGGESRTYTYSITYFPLS
jgi:hypothetical protein